MLSLRDALILQELKHIREELAKREAEKPPREIGGDVLAEFRRFLQIDLRLAERSVYNHVLEIRHFLQSVGKAPAKVTEDDIRNYLLRFKDASASKSANVLKALRRFFRDFMRMDITNGFKFPQQPIAPKVTPTKEELRKFYAALKKPRARALFLLYATSGMRRNEVLTLMLENVDMDKRMILSPVESTQTKLRWATFFNEETARALEAYIAERKDMKKGDRLFMAKSECERIFRRASEASGVKITPQILRDWFCSEMGELGVADRYVDAFCGRIPRSVLARHYTDFSPERLKRIYDGAGLRVLE
jgi:integrase/recombinase XerD